MKNTTQPKNQSRSTEKKELFFDSLDPLFRRYSQLYQQPCHKEEWNKYQREFYVFVQKLGIKLSDFKEAISTDLKQFLVTYYLIAEGRAPDYVIDHTYNLIVENSFELLMRELGKMVEELGQISKDIELTFRSIFISNSELDHIRAGLSIPQISIMKSGLLRFLICRGKIHSHKVEAILGTPYAPFVDCEPEEFLAYLFEMGSIEGLPMHKDALPIRRILDALLEIIMEQNEQLDAKSQAQSVA